MSKKRRREQPPLDTKLVEIYEDLANVDENIRFKAAHTLLTKFISNESTTGEQLNEILRRLIRGLCSGRKAARLGFSIALTESLTELFGPNAKGVEGLQDIKDLIETLKAQTDIGGNVSGQVHKNLGNCFSYADTELLQEERDHQFGRLFGAESVIKSSILFHSEADTGHWAQVLDTILELAKKKPWLREECGFVLFNAIQSLREQDLHYAQFMVNTLWSSGLTKTPEGVAIWIALRSRHAGIDFPRGVWHHGDPLNRKELSKLAKVLNEISIKEPAQGEVEEKVTNKGTWTTKLHFAWDVILSCLLHATSPICEKISNSSKQIAVADFWSECVDNTLFAKSSSDERKYWGFLLFQRMVKDTPENLLSAIFTPNLLRCLMNQLAGHERFLHVAAEKARKIILARARSDPNTTGPFLQALLTGPSGDVNFDKVTRTKTVETLLSQINDSTYKPVLAIYEKLTLQPGVQDDKEAASRRQMVANQLMSALRTVRTEHTNTGKDQSSDKVIATTRGILALFAHFAYFHLNTDTRFSSPSPPISQASRNMFRSRVSSCLACLLAKSADPAYFAYNLVLEIYTRAAGSDFGKSLVEVDKDIHEIAKDALISMGKANSVAAAESAGSPHAKLFTSIKLLYSLSLLQLYNEDADAVSMLKELNECFDSFINRIAIAESSAILVEILLSFVSKPSQLFRRMAAQVFTACASDVDGSALQSMIKVLETKESLSGQAEMFDQDDEMYGASEASDVEEVGAADAASTSSSAEDHSGDDDADSLSDSGDESDGPDEELAAFDAKLAQALGTRSGNVDLNAEDSSSSDEDMDDEEMEALDEHLQKVFQERKKITSKKTEKKDAKETIVNFKCRVLELLEIYVKQQHANSLALSLLVPVLTVLRTTTSPLVSNKACNLMREYSRVCKGDDLPSVEDVNAVFDVVEEVHVEAMKEGSNAHATACSQASLLLIRVLAAHDRECLRRVVKTYAGTLERALFDTSCKVKTSFFTDWQNWCAQARK